jgi:hypothetical protein
MFRLNSKSDKTADVKFCDGCGVTTRAERSQRRLDAARTDAATRGFLR